MPEIFFRNNVPVNSQVTIQIASDNGNVAALPITADAMIRKPDTSTRTWTDAELRTPATSPLILDQLGVYTGRVDLSFAAAATIRVKIDVLKPDGTSHLFNRTLSMAAPGLDFVHILLRVV